MAISRVQFKDASGTGTTLGVTPTTAPAQNNYGIILVEYDNGSSSVSSITQTNASWSRAVQGNNTGNGISCEIWVATVPASAGTTITVNFSASRSAKLTYVELSGTSITLDKTASSIDDSTLMGSLIPQTGTTATTTVANEYCIGIVAFAQNDADIAGHTNSFVEITEGTSAPDYTVAERSVSATGTYGFNVNTLGLPPTWYSAGSIITLYEVIVNTRRSGGSFM